DDDALVSALVADVCEPDAGVARGALDHRATRTQRATPLGVVDDRTRRTILHRAAGIEEFRLAENFAAGFSAEALEKNERCVAHRSRKSGRPGHADRACEGVGSGTAAICADCGWVSAARKRTTSPTMRSAGDCTPSASARSARVASVPSITRC